MRYLRLREVFARSCGVTLDSKTKNTEPCVDPVTKQASDVIAMSLITIAAEGSQLRDSISPQDGCVWRERAFLLVEHALPSPHYILY